SPGLQVPWLVVLPSGFRWATVNRSVVKSASKRASRSPFPNDSEKIFDISALGSPLSEVIALRALFGRPSLIAKLVRLAVVCVLRSLLFAALIDCRISVSCWDRSDDCGI
ncbi:hypothetical protein PFISCL1PPCAC_4034, partial [Pristionchus fissidentatus]